MTLTAKLEYFQTSSIPQDINLLTDDLEHIPIIYEEDFEKLLISLEINIQSTTNTKEQQVKIRRATEILNKINGKEIEREKSTLGSVSIHLSKSRGRNKSRRNRVIGLPSTGRKYSTEPFENFTLAKKKMYLLNLMFNSDQDFTQDVALAKKKIKICDLKHLKDNMPDALGSELIQPEILNKFFEVDAYKKLISLIQIKRKDTDWSCDVCHEDLGLGESIECDRCLYWSHWKCVGVKEEPADWICPKCQKA